VRVLVVLVVLVVVAVAAAGAWWLLAREAPPPEEIPEAASREGRSPPAPKDASAPPVVRGEPPPRPVDRENEMRWREAPLVLPAEGGTVTGKDLLAAVESAGLLTVKAAEEDLAALREARFPDLPRTAEMHHLVLEPLLRQAGFDVAVSYPTLHVRKRPPPREPN
jgi:hypothetical protein